MYPAGQIQGMQIDGVSMGAHQARKAHGSTVIIDVTFAGATRDSNGVGIPWDYRVGVALYVAGTQQLVAATLGPRTTAAYLVSIPQSISSLANPTVTIPAGFDNLLLDVRATLDVAVSDATGGRTAAMVTLPGDTPHLNAILVTPAAPAPGPAVPGGGIGTVDVSQGRRWWQALYSGRRG